MVKQDIPEFSIHRLSKEELEQLSDKTGFNYLSMLRMEEEAYYECVQMYESLKDGMDKLPILVNQYKMAFYQKIHRMAITQDVHCRYTTPLFIENKLAQLADEIAAILSA